jgi:MFS family permease
MVLPSGDRGDFPRVSELSKLRLARYGIEGLNSFATVLYFNYLYFFMRARFGYDDRQNLMLAAWLGLVYAVTAWQAGKFAHRLGYFKTLKLGFGVMIAGLGLGALCATAPGQIVAASIISVGMCATWPTLEAMVSEGETPALVPRAVGIYNIVWAVMYAVAFFIGGKIIEKFGFRAMFLLPALLLVLEVALTFWLERRPALTSPDGRQADVVVTPSEEFNRPTPARANAFLRMAWLSNPFAYIAINTLVAVLPGVAAKLQLDTGLAGVVCSLWCFARLGAFIFLWRCPAWHYRFRWLLLSFALLMFSFVAILVVPNLWVILPAQLFFGAATGLIYYSSLFYSMETSGAKSEHGGIHEAAIGLGNCAGPAVGALSLEFATGSPQSGAFGVAGLLALGLVALVWIQVTSRRRN